MTQRISAQHQSLQCTASDPRPGSFAGDLKVLSDTVYSSVSVKHGQATNILRINWSGDETLCNQHPGEFKLCHDEEETLKINVQHGDEISVTVFSCDGSILQLNSPFTEKRYSRQLHEKFIIRINVGSFCERVGNHAERALASLPFSPYTKRSKDEIVHVLFWEIRMCGKDGEGTVRARVMRPAGDTLPFKLLSFNTSFAVKQSHLREQSRTDQARAMDLRQIVSSFEPENVVSSSSDVATCDEQRRSALGLILSLMWEHMSQILADSGGMATGVIVPSASPGPVLLSNVADHGHEIIVDKVRYRLPPGKATPDQIRQFSEHPQVVKKWRDVIYELPRRPEGDESAFNEDDISRFEKSGGHSDAVASAIHEWFKQPQHTIKIFFDVLSNEDAGLELGNWPLKILAVKCDT